MWFGKLFSKQTLCDTPPPPPLRPSKKAQSRKCYLWWILSTNVSWPRIYNSGAKAIGIDKIQRSLRAHEYVTRWTWFYGEEGQGHINRKNIAHFIIKYHKIAKIKNIKNQQQKVHKNQSPKYHKNLQKSFFMITKLKYSQKFLQSHKWTTNKFIKINQRKNKSKTLQSTTKITKKSYNFPRMILLRVGALCTEQPIREGRRRILPWCPKV